MSKNKYIEGLIRDYVEVTGKTAQRVFEASGFSYLFLPSGR